MLLRRAARGDTGFGMEKLFDVLENLGLSLSAEESEELVLVLFSLGNLLLIVALHMKSGDD